MNYFRTTLLLAFLTGLFMAVGYFIGGQGGMVLAFLVAAGMNLFAYWNSDKVVLSMNNAQQVDARTAPELFDIVRQLAANAGLPMPKVYLIQADNWVAEHNSEVVGLLGMIGSEIGGLFVAPARRASARTSSVGIPISEAGSVTSAAGWWLEDMTMI